jgi:ankyrin repeat protein
MPTARTLLILAASALLPALAGASQLADLIRDGDRQAALTALRAGADVNALQADGSSPLLWAVYRVDRELVQELLQRGSKPDIRNSFGALPLGEAIDLLDLAMVNLLLQGGANPNLGNDDNQTPLMMAARAGSLPIAEALLKAGARVNEREKFREQTALMWAVAASSAEIVDLLIAHKAEVDIRAASTDWGSQITSEPRAQYRNTGGLTPLLFATRSGCVACAKSLLKAGADINRPTPEGVTPLMNAIDNNNYAVANLLLDEGADPHLSDWWGRTALYLSADMRTRGGAGGGGRGGPAGARPAADAAPAPPAGNALQVMQRLLEAGVDPNPQLNMHRPFRGRFTDDLITTGCTPLLRSALSGDREAVQLLLQHGALPDLPNVMGVTPLMATAGVGFLVGASGGGQGPIARLDDEANQDNAIAVIGMLIKAGADVNARITDTRSRTAVIARPSSMTDRQGQTALFGAVGNGVNPDRPNGRNWTRVAKFLIDNGARLDIKDDAGKTILDALEGKAGGRDDPSSEEMVKLVKGAAGR